MEANPIVTGCLHKHPIERSNEFEVCVCSLFGIHVQRPFNCDLSKACSKYYLLRIARAFCSGTSITLHAACTHVAELFTMQFGAVLYPSQRFGMLRVLDVVVVFVSCCCCCYCCGCSSVFSPLWKTPKLFLLFDFRPIFQSSSSFTIFTPIQRDSYNLFAC